MWQNTGNVCVSVVPMKNTRYLYLLQVPWLGLSCSAPSNNKIKYIDTSVDDEPCTSFELEFNGNQPTKRGRIAQICNGSQLCHLDHHVEIR